MIRRLSQILQSHPVLDRSLDSAVREEESVRYHIKEQNDSQPEGAKIPAPTTVLSVEKRDEVFAGLANGLSMAGLWTVQARNGTDAIRQYVRQPTALLVVNADHPAESAWLLVAKLHLTHPAARLWAYKRRLSPPDVSAAKFLNVDELIEYRDDLSRLTQEILDHFRTTFGPPASREGGTNRAALIKVAA